MTAEILIMNKTAIAMAADSMVTVTSKNSKKTYEGVNKLFMLCNNPPMGVMTYGNANFMDIPMETLIKEYKNFINSKSSHSENLLTAKLFIFDFLKFLEKYCIGKSSFDPKRYIVNVIDEVISFIDEEGSEPVKFFLKIFINTKLKNYKKMLKENQFKEYNHFFSEVLYRLGVSVDEREEYLIYLKTYILHNILNAKRTGIVIAGFDNDNPFPTLCSTYISCLIDNEIKAFNFQEKKIDFENLSYIKPFAQTDVVETYLKGISPGVTAKINEYFDEFITDYPKTIYSIIKQRGSLEENQLNEVKESLNELKNDDALKELNETIYMAGNEYMMSIKNAISVMPKEELANMAESLIHITSLKRKVEDSIETVGGDIDVAIITKGDGFIWTKRKHYFDPKLNYHFFDR